jgi:hypothetical protein
MLTARPQRWPRNGCNFTPLLLNIQFSYSVLEVAMWNLRLCLVDWACSVVLMNTDFFSFLMILFSPLCMISALLHSIPWSSYHECSAVLDLDIFPILVRLCSVILVLTGLLVSPMYLFQHSLYMQIFVLWFPDGTFLLLPLAKKYICEFWCVSTSYLCLS